MIIPPYDPSYPRRALELEEPPPLTISGPIEAHPLDGRRTVAIVGSRRAPPEALNWTHQLAYHLSSAGIVVISGGAVGVDSAAHSGALKAGATWCVACSGRDAPPFPPANADLFRVIEESPGSRMIWPFAATQPKTIVTPRKRNRVLIALADVIVVVQARIQSGSLNAASAAEALGRPLYVVTGRPWDYEFQGSAKLILQGAAPLLTIEQLFGDLDLPMPDIDAPEAILSDKVPRQPAIRTFKRRARSYASAPLFEVDRSAFSKEESLVYSQLCRAPVQQDKIVAKTGLGASATLTALLTLSLKDVVVEGPDGFFRVRIDP